MIRKLLFLSCFLFLLNCGNFQNQQEIKFKDGRTGTVEFEYQDSDSGDRILIADFTNEEIVRKESDVENDVPEIWSGVEKLEGSGEFEEGLIRYRYFTGEKSESGEKIYETLLFTTDRTESGKWIIKRVNIDSE